MTSYTEGLRNLAARPNADGTISFYAITAQTDTTSATGDADPDRLVTITDSLAPSTLPGNEIFSTVADSPANTVFRGIALAPVPEPSSLAALALGSIGLLARRRRA